MSNSPSWGSINSHDTGTSTVLSPILWRCENVRFTSSGVEADELPNSPPIISIGLSLTTILAVLLSRCSRRGCRCACAPIARIQSSREISKFFISSKSLLIILCHKNNNYFSNDIGFFAIFTLLLLLSTFPACVILNLYILSTILYLNSAAL